MEQTKFFAASRNQIFEKSDGDSWSLLWSSPDLNSPIQKLVTFPILPGQIFAITPKAIFMGNLKDRSWQMVYKDNGKIPLAFAVHPKDPNRWFLGTRRGLWESPNAGKTWSRSGFFSKSDPIPLLFVDKSRLFFANDRALYLVFDDKQSDVSENLQTENSSPARMIFGLEKQESEFFPTDLSQNENAVETVPLPSFKIQDMIRADRGRKLFLATQEGVFESLDEGHRWSPLSQSGLQSLFTRQLAYSEKEEKLFAATDKGIYAYELKKHRWQKLFEGLAKEEARSLALLNDSELIAITEEGFVQYPLERFHPEGTPEILIYQPSRETLVLFKKLIEFEPNTRELHKNVIRYANVSNGKIKRWHLGSRIAALLPTVSYGRDFSTSNNIDLDRGGTNDPDRFIGGPNDTDSGWDARVGWDLGDAVYSSDQTSIDSREKLMVELRNDLLSEATRIYYERRRLQIGLVFNPAASEQEHLENLLRIDELTSLLDSLTNGFFSERLGRIYDEYPEFNKLWIFQGKGAAEAGL